MSFRLTLAAIAITSATAVLAHQGASGIVKERMDAMGSIAANVKSVSQMLRGSLDYDPAAVQAAMEAISAHAATLPEKFPEGTDHAPSEAAPTIWTDTDGFNAIFAELEGAAAATALVADDKAAVQQGFGVVAKTCKSCHATYRIERD